MRIRNVVGLAALTLVVTAVASCGDVVRSSRSPVILVVNSLTSGSGNVVVSDVDANGTVTNDLVSATLSTTMKSFTAPTSTNNRVTIKGYHVQYRRADGRNTPGVDVPFAFDAAATATIDANSSTSMSIEIVRHDAKLESPLIQLLNEVRVINAIADVTFFGQDQVGNDVSATGSIYVDFGNIGAP